MLGVEGMALRLFADRMHQLATYLFPRRSKSFGDKRQPIFFGDRSEGIMSARAIQRARTIHKHFLDKMLPAAEKEVGDFAVILDHTAELLLHAVVPVLENLLEFVENKHHIMAVLSRQLRRRLQNFVQRRTTHRAMFRQAETHFGLTLVVDGHAGSQITEKRSASLQELFHGRAHRMGNRFRESGNKGRLAIGWP